MGLDSNRIKLINMGILKTLKIVRSTYKERINLKIREIYLCRRACIGGSTSILGSANY